MIETIRQRFIAHKIQFVKVSKDGLILESENNLFSLQTGTSIFNVHPFFESIQYYFTEPEGQIFNLACINLEIGDIIGVYDVDIDVLSDALVISIIDFTNHYKISNTLSQEKNESVIQGQILKEQEAFKNRFLANTSHELRTPLTTIMGFATILERSNITLAQLHTLNVIKSSCEQLKNVVDDILDISRIEMGKLRIVNERFDFIKFLEHINDTYVAVASGKGLKFTCNVDKNIPKYLVGDKYRLSQILTNLIDNAIKFTEEGSVTLNIKNNTIKGNKVPVVFSIKDTGKGIDKDKLDYIFDSFSQVGEDDHKKGTGLGLSIVKHLIRLMKGEIKVSSIRYKGTTFKAKVNLGVAENQDNLNHINEDPEGAYQGKKFNILIAEDIEINQLLIMKILSDYKKYYFDIASDGDQVIDLLHKSTYDLILMDLKMPKMDGYDTTRFIRQSTLEEFNKIPIIAITAKVSTLEREKCLKYGMNEYIGKPFRESELIRKISAILEK